MATLSANQERPGFRITGRKVLFGLIAFFGLITVANVIMIWLAIGTFPGVVTNSAYQAGREYPAMLAAAEAQQELGWQVQEHISAAGADEPLAVRIDANDRDGAPLSGLSVTVGLASPTHEGLDRRLALTEGEIGLYQGVTDGLPAGQYNLTIEAEDGDGKQFRSVNRIVIADSGKVR